MTKRNDKGAVGERLAALREKMAEQAIDACLIPTGDFHMSEYGSGHFKSRAYFSGFNGSAGTLVVLADGAALWTDGRYFLQAADQLAGTGIDLMKQGLEETPSISDYLLDKLAHGGVLAFDGRTVAAKEGLAWQKALGEKNISLQTDFDPAEGIWQDRPPLPAEPVWILEETYAGKSAAEKLAELKESLEQETTLIVTRLDEIAWLLNLRGGDIPYNPVFLSFLFVNRKGTTLFVDQSRLPEEVIGYLAELDVALKPYEEVYQSAGELTGPVQVDLMGTNYRLYDVLVQSRKADSPVDLIGPVAAEGETDQPAGIRDVDSPVMLAKAIKNDVEIDQDRAIHVQDGVAMVRFMKWLKEQMGLTGPGQLDRAAKQSEVTEISATAYLDDLRYAIPGNLGLSFPTIAGYAAHGAIIHYTANEETDIPLEPKGLLLVDSGGHYKQGTTDITRTFALGPLTDEEKAHFALVLRCMLHLMKATFPKGLAFENLDVLARLPLWAEGLDYLHGTGHGVGYLLNVHEGPNRFHWKPPADRDMTLIEPGMITTDEPGVYIADAHGIRLENELLCVEKQTTEYGTFLGHESLTLCPIDLDALDPALLDDRELGWLNEYHQIVYEKLAPHLSEDEADWLARYTAPVVR